MTHIIEFINENQNMETDREIIYGEHGITIWGDSPCRPKRKSIFIPYTSILSIETY